MKAMKGIPHRFRAALSRPGLRLRKATVDDTADVWRWNNEASVRRASLDPRPIPREAHDAWMAARLADARCKLWIVEVLGEAVGVVRIQRDADGDAPGVVSIALDPAARGLGLGRTALGCAMEEDGGPLTADILADNRASRGAFEHCGFRLGHRGVTPDGRAVLTYEWRNAHAVAI